MEIADVEALHTGLTMIADFLEYGICVKIFQ